MTYEEHCRNLWEAMCNCDDQYQTGLIEGWHLKFEMIEGSPKVALWREAPEPPSVPYHLHPEKVFGLVRVTPYYTHKEMHCALAMMNYIFQVYHWRNAK